MLAWQFFFVSLQFLLVELWGRVAMHVFLCFVSDFVVAATHTVIVRGRVGMAIDMAVFIVVSGV